MPEDRRKAKGSWLIARGVVSLAATAGWLLACNPAGKTVPALVFSAPEKQISTFERLPFESKDHFGAAMALDGNLLAVGAPIWGYPGAGAGSVQVFRRGEDGKWSHEADLATSDRDDGFQYDQHLGEAVALNGSVLAAGAPGRDDRLAGDNTGAAYLYEWNGTKWKETTRLETAQKIPGARLGSSVEFSGELLVMSGSPQAGLVASFRKEPTGWIELEPIPIAPDPGGAPVYVLIDLLGETLAVSSAPWPEPPVNQDETAFIKSLVRESSVSLYQLDGYTWKRVYQTPPQEAALFRVRSDAPFGLPVALGGSAGKANLLAIGKPGFTASGREAGSVMIYQRSTWGWQPQAEIALVSDPAAEGALPFFGEQPGAVFFGGQVSLEGNRLAVVSMFANTAYVFDLQNGDWVYRARLTPGKDYYDDFMRRVTCLEGDRLILGSPGDLGGGNVFAFSLGD